MSIDKDKIHNIYDLVLERLKISQDPDKCDDKSRIKLYLLARISSFCRQALASLSPEECVEILRALADATELSTDAIIEEDKE